MPYPYAMRGLALACALAAPVLASDIVADYQAAKARRDAAAADLARQSALLEASSGDTMNRLSAARAVEKAQLSLQSASADLNAVVRQMKPGDAIWVQETKVGQTDRYAPQIPDPGAGAPLDWRMGAIAPIKVPEAPGVGFQRAAGEPGRVSYGRPAGFANSNEEAQGRPLTDEAAPRLLHAPQIAPRVTLPAPVPAPADEGRPFAGPLPPAAVNLTFLRFGDPIRFPVLNNPRRSSGDDALRSLSGVAREVERGDLEGAWRGTQGLLAFYPDDPGVQRLAAGLLLRLGRAAEAEAHARESIRLDGTNPEAWTVLAWSLLRQGKRREAAAAALSALALDPLALGAAAALTAMGLPPAATARSAGPLAAAALVPAGGPGVPPTAAPMAPRRLSPTVLAIAAAAAAAAAFGAFLRPRMFRRKI